MLNRSQYFIISYLMINSPAHAYIGPGIGIGAIGLTIAMVIGLFLLITGFIWYPLKRLIHSLRKIKNLSKSETEDR